MRQEFEKMNISVKNLSFGYSEVLLFNHFNAEFGIEENGRPLVILGPSGCGKTTLLKLLGNLLKPREGEIVFSEYGGDKDRKIPNTAFMFQEPRLLPWLTVLENIALPLEKIFGKTQARERARYFLSLVSLDESADAMPGKLSGGQRQRVSMARAFAWPSPVLLMDEPFQSLDIPLRINLMDLCLDLQEKENSLDKNLPGKNRILIAITHDPREAIYMSGRTIILGNPGEGIIYEKRIDLKPEDRAYGSAAAGELEKEMIKQIVNNK